MKKSLLALAAGVALTAASAEAATVYFQNTGNWPAIFVYQWGGNGENKWPGTQIATSNAAQNGAEFVTKDGIKYLKWETECKNIIFNNNSGTQTPDLVVVDNAIYNAGGVTGQSWTGGEIVIPDTENVYLMGTMNEWKESEDYKFAMDGDGVFTLALPSLAASAEFKIQDADKGTWYTSTNKLMETGVTYRLQDQGGDNMGTADNLTDVTITFNLNDATVVVNGTGSETPITYSWALKGSFTTNWEAKELTEEDGVWSATLTIPANFNFGFVKYVTGEDPTPEANQKEWNNTAKATAYDADGSVAHFVTGGNGTNYTISAGGEYKFEFNPTANTLVVTVAGEVGHDQWFAAYDMDKEDDGASWKFGNAMEHQAEGTWKYFLDSTGSANENTYFALFYGLKNTGWNDGKRYVPKGAADVKVDEDGTYEIEEGSDGAWVIANGEWTIVLDPATMTISFDKGDTRGEANFIVNGVSQPMTQVGDTDVYTWNGELQKTDEIYVNIEGVDYYFVPGSVATIAVNESYTLSTEGTPYSVPENGPYTFNVDTVNKSVALDSEVEVSVKGIEAAEGEAVYFNLQGVRVANPVNGLYITVKNGKASKVVVK